MIKTKKSLVKADYGRVCGYAATWTKEPDSYGDICRKGCFAESLDRIKRKGKVLPLLYNHKSDSLFDYIGTIVKMVEDDHGLYFEAEFEDTPQAQQARKLAISGRFAGCSFAYDVVEQGKVKLPDGRTANELRRVNIHEISLCLYPANRDTSITAVKAQNEAEKKRRALRRAKELLRELGE